MVKLREIADNNTNISSTRWAFATVIKFDIFIILVTLATYIVGHFIDKPLPESFISSVVLLMGVLTSIITASKALQGFETKYKYNKKEEDVKEF